MKNTRILLVVKEDTARNVYVEILGKIGVVFDVVTSFTDASSMARNIPYNGLLVDILALVRVDQNEKNIAHECMNFYPSTRIKWDARHKTIHLLMFSLSSHFEAESALRIFIAERCKPFAARSLRVFNRKNINLNLLLSLDCHCSDEKAAKTFLLDLSQGGCFLHTVQPLDNGQEVWLRCLELSDPTPIKAVVCWQLKWGLKQQISGIGVKFESLSEIQGKEIKKILGR
ncbi:MAG: PilZ domain-containing protein [Deltaproteobacteria bacterium]|nr:PilZ domain-containing protein [Deltaproteobacteria bacterium]